MLSRHVLRMLNQEFCPRGRPVVRYLVETSKTFALFLCFCLNRIPVLNHVAKNSDSDGEIISAAIFKSLLWMLSIPGALRFINST